MPDTSRRDFLGFLGVGVAASAAPPAGKPLVAGHPWVYAATRPQNEITPILDAIFEDMRYAGLDAIELMHTALRPDDAVRRIGELSRRHSLPVLGTSFSADMWNRDQHAAILSDVRLVVPRLSGLGGRTFGATVGRTRQRKTPGQLDAQADVLRKIMSICKDQGVVVNLHNHAYEVADNEYDLRGTLERVPEARLGPDLDWLLTGGVDPVDFIRRHGRRIVFAHLRDQKADKTWPEAMGEGDMDYRAIGRAFREAGFSGDFAIELAHRKELQLTRPLRESLKLSREYVRKQMGY
jgi:sugar phosphate isomerase/epimerase